LYQAFKNFSHLKTFLEIAEVNEYSEFKNERMADFIIPTGVEMSYHNA